MRHRPDPGAGISPTTTSCHATMSERAAVRYERCAACPYPRASRRPHPPALLRPPSRAFWGASTLMPSRPAPLVADAVPAVAGASATLPCCRRIPIGADDQLEVDELMPEGWPTGESNPAASSRTGGGLPSVGHRERESPARHLAVALLDPLTDCVNDPSAGSAGSCAAATHAHISRCRWTGRSPS